MEHLKNTKNTENIKNNGPLKNIRVLDMTRVLAGPSATQMLGDMGADVIKIERIGTGDDTRKWGPPFIKKDDGSESTESSYYLSANRNKRSLAIDFTSKKGAGTIRQLAEKADILIENYKVGNLARYGLSYSDLAAKYPHLIYCSLTGFGQTGPLCSRPGYDFMIQAMGGIMSLTGEPDGAPMKTGVAIADLMAGNYATIAILAALHHRDNTGKGQHIDMALYDCQLAWLSNAGQYYLTSGEVTPRMGNAHPTIVPYQVFTTKDSHIVLAIGNDIQFARFCEAANEQELAKNKDYIKNSNRVKYREKLVPIIADIMASQTTEKWIEILEKANIPHSPIANMETVFSNPQTLKRNMKIEMEHTDTKEKIELIGSPLKFSETEISYRHSPPKCGENSAEILEDWLGISGNDATDLIEKGIIGDS